MRTFGTLSLVLLTAGAVAACGDVPTISAPDNATRDEAPAGGGYGSGGRNLIPTGTPSMDGGGGYGSGGFTAEDTGGGYGSGGETQQAGDGQTITAACVERGGGGYGSGGRTGEECVPTEPTL